MNNANGFTTMDMTALKKYDIIDNGFYIIQLMETPRYNDVLERWLCRGKRWVYLRRDWEQKSAVYGWREPDFKIIRIA